MSDEQRTVLKAEFLHVHAEQTVKGKLINLPKRAHGDGKAERKQPDKQGTELYMRPLGIVQDGYERKTERAEHHGGEAVQESVPLRNDIEKAADFAEIDRAIEKDEIHHIDVVRHSDAQVLFQQRRQEHHDEPQQALREHEQVIAAQPRSLRNGFRDLRRGKGHIGGKADGEQQRNEQDPAENQLRFVVFFHGVQGYSFR